MESYEDLIREKIRALGGDPDSLEWNVEALVNIWTLYNEDKVDEAIEMAMTKKGG